MKEPNIYLKLKKSSWDNFFRVMKWRKNPIELMEGHGSIGNFWACIQSLQSQYVLESKESESK